ncbi:MAG TPA: hypothetical protein VK487_06390 [Candidatus Bathyarchaeia archaeon]|nr:hypothetical protein [Candidatus Bathyarchaeia archaeon]
MSKTTVELNLRTIFGLIFMVIGLIMLLYIAVTSLQLSTGAVKPLSLNVTGTYAVNSNYNTLYGILLQLGMFLIVVVIAYILLRVGLSIMRKEEE